MRINYEIKDNIFKICDEYSGIDQFKRTVLKKNKIVPYTRFLLGQLILCLFVTILLIIPFHDSNVDIIIDCSLLMFFFVILQAMILFTIYLNFRKLLPIRKIHQ